MAVVNRSSVAAPTLPKQTVEVAALDGEVIVRGLLLTERLAIEARVVGLRKAGEEVNAILPAVLAQCVLAADELPLWTEQEWQVFGVKHQGQALALFNVAWRLSGFAEAQDAKN